MKSHLYLSLVCASLLLCARAGQSAVFNIPDGDVAALKNAITIANTNGQADTINLAANSTYTLTAIDNAINGPNGLPQLKDDVAGSDLTVNGNGATIRRSSNTGTPEFRIMHVDVGATVDLNGLVIINGAGTGPFPSYRGAGILITSATLNLTNCRMHSHVAREGAAIYSSKSALTLRDCAIEENQAEHAGAIFNLEGSVTATGSTFIDNVAHGSTSANTPGRGGAIYSKSENSSATIALTGCTFIGNRILGLAQGSGGAIYNQRGSSSDATVALTNCTFENNFGEDASGGAIASNAAASLTGCTLRGNYSRTGGAILQTGGALDVRGSTFEQNVATRNPVTNSGGAGGAIMTIAQTTLTVLDSAFRNNEAGTSAGAIQNGGAASITNTELSENAASYFGGAIGNYGQLTLVDTDLVGNDSGTSGGAIFTAQEATLRRCLVEDNTSASAGGIANSGTLTIESSTLHNNRATAPAGAGGAIGTQTASTPITTTVRDSTLSNNTAANGAGIHNIGSLKLTNSTLSSNAATARGGGLLNRDGTSLIIAATFCGNAAANGGGIYNEKFGAESTVTLLSSILQAGATGANIVNASGGTFFSSGYNLSSDAAGGDSGTGPGGLLNNSDDVRNTNPNLGPLQNNGGGTQTHALLVPSPAIDTGDGFIQYLPFQVKNDQRGPGFPRQIGERIDKGAFESGVSVVVTTIDDHNDGACTAKDCTLREAIIAANLAGVANISFASGVTGTIQLTEALPDLRGRLVLEGPGADLLTVRRNSGGDYRILTVNNGTPSGPRVSLSGLTISNGKTPEGSYPGNSGGGIFNERGVLSVTRCVITGNRTAGDSSYGGGIFNEEGTLLVRESTVTGNVAPRGGGIASLQEYPGNAFVYLGGCTLSGNTAQHGDGGGIYNAAINVNATALVSMSNSTLSGNSATVAGFVGGNGGAIYNLGRTSGTAEFYLEDCTLSGNTAPSSGGIYNNSFSATARVSLQNTILKRGANGSNFINSSGEIMSLGHNLCDDAAGGLSGTGPGGHLNATGDMRETDPLLGPLQNNGGPTATHALLAGSPAINAGAESFTSYLDQRGYVRAGVNDIGAFEAGATPPVPPAPISAVSRKQHGSAGAFDIDLLAAPSRTECRSGGAAGAYQIVVTFANDVALTDFAISSSDNLATGTVTVNGRVITIDLAQVANAQAASITLINVTDEINTGDIVIPFRVLVGDTNGNGTVSASDIGQLKTQAGQPVTGANFRSDLNANGAINSTDISLVKSRSGTQLP